MRRTLNADVTLNLRAFRDTLVTIALSHYPTKRLPMGTLNPNLLSKHTALILNESAKIMPTLGKRLLMPEIVLLGLVRTPDTSARRILDKVAQERGFKLGDLDATAVAQLKTREGRPADFVFVLDSGGKVELSDELLQIIDEALTIAQASDEVWIGTEHLLSALSQRGVSTAGLLQARGITPQALEPYLKDRSISRRMTTRDWVADARSGELTPAYFRENLLRELISVLSLAGQRHVLLVGAAGSGRRSLAYSLALLIAEGRGPQGIDRVIEIAESALLDNPVEALRSGVKQAIGGALFIPNVARFFDRFMADKVKNIVQKAFLDKAPIVIGTATDAKYNESLKQLNNVHVLKVPSTSVEETTLVLNALKSKFEHGIRADHCGGRAVDGVRDGVAVSVGRSATGRGDSIAASRLRAGAHVHANRPRLQAGSQTRRHARSRRCDAGVEPDDGHPRDQTGAGRTHQVRADGRVREGAHHRAG